MKTRLFDIQTGFGGVAKGKIGEVTLEELLGEMRRLDIEKALVRTLPDEQIMDVPSANELLLRDCEKRADLVPCPILMPNGGGDLASEEEQIGAFVRRGAGAVALRPKEDYWSLSDWASGPLFRELEKRQLPALCHLEKIDLEALAEIAGRYPRLPLLLAAIGYRAHRTLIPLMKRFPNLYASIGNPYTVHDGIECLVEEVGPERLLFGSGYPGAEPMGAIGQLVYADVSDDAKGLIGHGNAERLLKGIVR